MTNTKILFGLVAVSSLVAVGALAGCGSDTGSGTTGTGGHAATTSTTDATSTGVGGSTSTATGTGGGGTPAPPKIGAQIDRFGRPAINTALNKVFETDMAKKNAGKDAYNSDSDMSKWGANYGAEFAGNLGILDALDTKCGNQILAGAVVDMTRYQTLAGALSDDRIYVKSDAATCTTYLAVEANATLLNPNMDCGGRKLDYDVIETSYSALAAGVLAGVDDGVKADADTKGTTFPYLTAPH